MVLTFPHMGSVHILIKALLDDYGIDYVIPDKTSKKTLETGTRYCPEGVCLPLKITVGNIISGCEKGADTLLTVGGNGPCRYGYYCEMQREIIHDIGYPIDVITLEKPEGGVFEFIRRLVKLTGRFTPLRWTHSFLNIARLSKDVDEIETLCQKKRVSEAVKGTADRYYEKFKEDVYNVKGSDLKEFIEKTKYEMSNIQVDENTDPIKIKIVGEIYTTIDPFTNMYLEKTLGELGAEAVRPVTISSWVNDHMLKKTLGLLRDTEYENAALPYLKTMIGGHALETVGNTVLAAEDGFDGVIQVYPLGCMPEIVAQSVLKPVSNDHNIPVLTLIIDELTGEQGYLTRIEAFVDLLKQRRQVHSAHALDLRS